MIPLGIYYTPGARGDFLSNLLQDNIQLVKFKYPYNRNWYTKLHNLDQFLNFKKSNQFMVKISTTTAKELVDTTLLHFKKNDSGTLEEYDRLFIVCKNTLLEEYKSEKFIYSYVFKFSNFNNVEEINKLYQAYNGTLLSQEHINFISETNKINNQYLDECYSDVGIIKLLKLLEFEIENSCLFKQRLFEFSEYLVSSECNTWLTTSNYIDVFRPH